MKKLVVFVALIMCLFSMSCDNKYGTNQVTSSDQHTEITQIETNETTNNLLIQSDNIQKLDLSLSENSTYLQYRKIFSYNNEYVLSDGRKIIEDKNLYLEDLSGNKSVLIEVPEEETEKYVVFWDMIDNNRFCYYIINHETTGISGIYDLEGGEVFHIDVCDDNSAYVPKKVVENYLYFSKGFISDFKGVGKLNLDNYEFIEIDCSPLFDNNIYLGESDISPDGTKAAIYGIASKASKPNELNEYQVAIYSLTEEKILETYNFFSEDDYINCQLVYCNKNQVYLYASQQYGNNPKEFLYIINL